MADSFNYYRRLPNFLLNYFNIKTVNLLILMRVQSIPRNYRFTEKVAKPIFADRIQFRILLTSIRFHHFLANGIPFWTLLNIELKIESLKLFLCRFSFHKLNVMIGNKNVNGLDGVFNVLLHNSKVVKFLLVVRY